MSIKKCSDDFIIDSNQKQYAKTNKLKCDDTCIIIYKIYVCKNGTATECCCNVILQKLTAAKTNN